jgi:hypothetical protein
LACAAKPPLGSAQDEIPAKNRARIADRERITNRLIDI